jgi:hypothetical protein
MGAGSREEKRVKFKTWSLASDSIRSEKALVERV